MESKKRMLPGEARVEYIACAEIILEMTTAGHTAKNIYRYLIKENKISMAYTTFASLMRKYVKNKAEKKNIACDYMPPMQPVQQKQPPQSPQFFGDTSDIHKNFEPVKYAGNAIIKKEEE